MPGETVARPPSAGTPPTAGLTSEEAARRLAERGPAEQPGSSRSYASIVRANVFTVFNLILAFFGGLMLAFGSWQDALFLGVLVSNALIGIVQEVRAKRALDRLSALVVPTATALRDGKPTPLAREEVVVGDVVVLQPGDQLVADGHLESGEGLLLDEPILSGESHPVGDRPFRTSLPGRVGVPRAPLGGTASPRRHRSEGLHAALLPRAGRGGQTRSKPRERPAAGEATRRCRAAAPARRSCRAPGPSP